MAKNQRVYVCGDCGTTSIKWQGQCPGCGRWNTLEAQFSNAPAAAGSVPEVRVRRLAEVGSETASRIDCGIGELNRVLGGGLVPGSAVLIGGDPGIGKSTLLIQACARLAAQRGALYVTGEESLQQVRLRASRLGLDLGGIAALSTTRVEEVLAAVEQQRPACVVIDSIQTIASELVPSPPGSPNQLRTCASQLVRLAKTTDITVLLVGHVTKEGQIAGPRLLEHMVDVVLYFENEAGSRYRILRAVKNRFGAANELGIFVMTDAGIKEVRNPSALFVAQRGAPVAGSVVTAVHQGSRPLLVEVQALTDPAAASPPRRMALGLESGRLTLLLATLHRHGGVGTHACDVFVNVVGGVRVGETAADLAALLAIVSSFRDEALPRDLVAFGEVGLAGEVRPVAYGEERLREAAKVGFARAILPRANLPKRRVAGLELTPVAGVRELLGAFAGLAAGAGE